MLFKKKAKKEDVPASQSGDIVIQKAETDEPHEVETLSEVLEQAQPKRRRRTSRGTRRGQRRFAALIGLIVIFFALIGVVALGFLSVGLIRKATDHSDLMIELRDLASPLIEYQPTAFDTPEEADDATLLQAAIFRVTEAERIRQLQEKTDTYNYETDDNGRLILPVEEVNASFKTLFGDKIDPHHQTLGEDSGVAYTFEYDKANACYHVPVSVGSSLYTTKADAIRLHGNEAQVRINYALTKNLPVDKYGNTMEPDGSTTEYAQWFHFVEADGGWILTAVEDVK